MRDRLRRFLYGRYGRDQLNIFLSIVSIILLFISLFVRNRTANWILIGIAVLILIVTYFRTFSRNISKRYAENQKFLALKNRLFRSISGKKRQMQDKDHAYFRCPNCKKRLRVPKGKGTISIHCPQCGTDFIERT